ncbi:hypothetical protein D3C79_814470 [compost metagenome]
MGTQHHAQRVVTGHRVKGNPVAGRLLSVHAVVRQVLVPGRWLGRSGFFDQNMVMEYLHVLGLHQAPGNTRRR